VTAFGPGQRVVIVESGLWNLVRAKVPGVLDLIVVPADQGDASQQRRVAVHDSQLHANVCAIGGRQVSESRADKAPAKLVNHRLADGGSKTHRGAPRVIEVRARTEPGRQRCQACRVRLIRAASAEPYE
jgi:hypothetical protein